MSGLRSIALLNIIKVASHVGRAARVNWTPWSNHAATEKHAQSDFLGWRVTSHDDQSKEYVYMVPDLDAETVAVDIYIGPHGVPAKDTHLARLEKPNE